MGYGSEIIKQVSAWEEVDILPHRFGGTEFRMGNVEIGHIHGDEMVDIPYTVKIRTALLNDDEAEPHHLLPESGWISFYLREDKDVTQAVKLFRISYLQKRLRRLKADKRSTYEQEVTKLGVSDAVKDVLLNRATTK